MSKEKKSVTQKQEAPFYSRAAVDANTVISTEKEKSFEVVFATETPCFRRSWDENFNEILSCEKSAIRTGRLDNNAVPLLDNHPYDKSAANQMGRVDSYTIAKNECRAKIIFSTQEKFDGIWKDIVAGIIRSISVGYMVYKYLREPMGENVIPNYRAVDWEPMEISLAPVPLDFKSQIRSEQDVHDVIIENFNNEKTRTNMADEKTGVEEKNETPKPENGSRSAENPAAPVVAPAVDEAKIRKEAVAAEKQRSIDIRFAVRTAKMDEKFADELIEKGVSVEDARAQIFQKMAEDSEVNIRNTNPTIVVDEVENTRKAMSEGLLFRANPGSVKLEGKAHDFKYMSMLDLARTCLIAKGDKGNYSPNELVKRAISTTDYPNLLNSTVERAIRRTYDSIPPEWQNIARRTTAKDFREKTGIAVDGKVTFEEISEGGEYKHSLLLTDDSAKIKLKTYGRKISITRQAIINDDLSVFEKLPALIARGAANFQAGMVWALITSNAKTPDNKAMFHTDHKNLAASGAALSETTLSAARIAMWRQTSPAGELMPVAPKILLVPVELLTTAEKLMSGLVTPGNTSDVNVFANKFQIQTSPFLTNATAWYLIGDPQSYEGLVYAYLEGEEGLFIDKEVSFDNDSVTTKARLDFACATWDYRAWYKNAGA